MRTSAESYLTQVNKGNTVRRSFRKMQRLLTLMVIPAVFWGLKLTGITMAGEAFCGMEEHVHSEACVCGELICQTPETPSHIHGEACRNTVLNCDLPEQEGHTHDESCLSRLLICTQEEIQGHAHMEDCYTTQWHCELPEEEAHSHGEGCYVYENVCGLEASEEHTHDESCGVYSLVCGMPETDGHAHNSDCYTKTLTCQLEQTEGHTHGEGCYVTEEGYFCGQEERQEHFHTADCYLVEEDHYICGQEETEGHSHDQQCYNMLESCPIAEHIHTPNCYSDISADLETEEDWEGSLSELIRSSNAVENVLMVARSQLGVAESTRNFQVDELGVRRGITRYGQWYGNPYGDWSAMFTAFCLDYAGVEAVPRNGGVESMRQAWEEAEMFIPVEEEIIPAAGDLMFLDKDEDGEADAVAIVTDQKENVIFAIEGDLDQAVIQIGSVKLHPQEETEATEQTEETVSEDAEPLPENEDTAGETEPQEAEESQVFPEQYVIMRETLPADAVAETLYLLDDSTIMGYGWVPMEMDSGVFAPDDCYIWLDGTGGNMGHLNGSPNTMYTFKKGSTITLPDDWTSPKKYSYKLRGWYDITNSKYYQPGAEMEVTGNAVLYADWVASTYDIGVFNTQVADTVSTNSFITTHMFDYNYLFNVQSAKAQITVSNRSHSETWSMVTDGTVPYQNQNTFNFIFVDNDSGGRLCIPNNRSSLNVYPGAGIVTPNIYSDNLGDLLFATDNSFDPATGTGIMGKTYLGTGDHLFQIVDDPNDEHYGYYYYDSARNAASYNQSRGRFYVYEYLECTSDAIGSTYSDFLPLNSPDTNTNGLTVSTYNYAGIDGEYQGVSHYRYEAKYNAGSSVQTDYAYGMRSDIQFYLPNDPGSGGNRDLNGNPMMFEFSGDDDLWILVDGVLVLDIGGIHGAEEGVIDFSTGQVTVQGKQQDSLMKLGITAGDHTLSVLYLERGSSLSNCSIYFNMAPRFGLELKKEDVLTQELLDGAQFAVYEDLACTQPVMLWESEEAYRQDYADGELNQRTNTFTVTNGVAQMWGLGSGNTYYLKETRPPGQETEEGYVVREGYGQPWGIIRLTVEKGGLATSSVEVIADSEGNEPSKGFTVHGVQIDETTKTVYLTVTNAPESVKETTTVQVIKKWEDDDEVDHSGDYIEAYLTVINPDGTSRHIREVVLSNENDWQYIWTNLPKYDYDNLTEVTYGIEESYESGYYSKVVSIEEIEIVTETWSEALSFADGQTYVLKTSNGYLSTTSATDTKLKWITDEKTAKTSPLSLWTVDINGNQLRFINKQGHVLGADDRGRNGQASASIGNNQRFTQAIDQNKKTVKLRIVNGSQYYLTGTISNNGKISGTYSSSNAVVFTPLTLVTSTTIQQVENWAYEITNTPLAQGNETSLTVQKEWVIPEGYDQTLYEESAVVVRLLADGVNTGRTVTLTLKNGWSDTFQGLPYKDEEGNVIRYTVEELWEKEYWSVTYGEIKVHEEAATWYSTTVTNSYHQGGPKLPSTGTAARMIYVLFGGGMMLTSLAYGILLRCRRERRRHKPF